MRAWFTKVLCYMIAALNPGTTAQQLRLMAQTLEDFDFGPKRNESVWRSRLLEYVLKVGRVIAYTVLGPTCILLFFIAAPFVMFYLAGQAFHEEYRNWRDGR